MIAGDRITYPFDETWRGYLVPSTGRFDINGVTLETRDGALIRDEADLTLTALEEPELVLAVVSGRDRANPANWRPVTLLDYPTTQRTVDRK
jgi:redox-sensitive bicupin YhaK (pirin superfamily)